MDQKGEIEEELTKKIERRRQMARDKTYVTTASVYVDYCRNEEEATEKVEALNEDLREAFGTDKSIQIRLTDNTLLGPEGWDESESHWELSGSTSDEK